MEEKWKIKKKKNIVVNYNVGENLFFSHWVYFRYKIVYNRLIAELKKMPYASYAIWIFFLSFFNFKMYNTLPWCI